MYKIILILFFPILLYSKFQVTTTFPLETYIAKEIGKSNIRIKQITKHFNTLNNRLDKKQVSRFSGVKVFLHFGFEIEKDYAKQFIKRNSDIIISDMTRGIKKNVFNEKVNHFVWMDPLFMRIIAQNVYDTFVEIDKFNKEEYFNNLNIFLNKIDKYFLEVKERLDKSDIFNIIVFDENWYYFANRFRLNLYRYKKENMTLAKIRQVRNFTLKNNIKAMFIDSNASKNKAKSLLVNTDVKIIINDVFRKTYFMNLLELSKELSSK